MTKPYRLPGEARPTRYELHLHAHVGEPKFRGSVRIHLQLARAMRNIELHARDLEFTSVRALASGVDEAGRADADPEREMVALRFAKPLPAGEATLEIAYEGTVSKSMEGLYLSKDGAEECLSTQCEETDARAIFPCFDEPSFKAPIELTVTTTPDVVVLANAPRLSAKVEGEGKTWRFAPTKPMSSYLFAVSIGRFGATEERVVRGVPMRVHAMRGKEHLGGFGLEFAGRLLPWFEDYFGAPYHFDKYDQLAVPSFSAGAMENSGLVIFRQSLLLRDPETTSHAQEKLIARIIAHEFAHQWFGNLVTMAWWDDIWLNESFAEWIAHKAADAVEPEYKLWDDFHENKRDALITDALATTHAIYTPVETPEQATELFDTVTYSKGSVLMRMVERYLGEETFRAGLRTYMKEFAEKNARGDDLWRHLEKASNEPVTRLLASWILQPGYPVVRARLEGTTLRLSQRRFYSDPKAPPSDATWAIPLVVRWRDAAGVHETRHLLDAREGALALPARGALDWAQLDADAVGFYRQDLSDELRAKLVANAGALSGAEQRDLLDNAWAFARANMRPIEAFLDALGPVAVAARDHHVLAQVVESLEEVHDILADATDATALDRFRRFVAETFGAEALRLGWDARPGESRDDNERRAHVLRAMARLARDADAQRAAVSLAQREARDPTSVDPTLAGPAVGLAARAGDEARHDAFLALYETRRDAKAPPNLTQRYLYSLALFEDEALLARTMTLLAEGRFPQEALGPMLRTMLGERHAREAAWEYLQEHWSDIRTKLGDMWTGFLVEHTGNLPPSRREEMVRFFDANLQGVAQQSYARALEAMDLRAAFDARAAPAIASWLAARETR